MDKVFDPQPLSVVNTFTSFPVPLHSLFSDEKWKEEKNWFCFDDFFRKEAKNFKTKFLWKVFSPLFDQCLPTISDQQRLSFRFLSNSIELIYFLSEKVSRCQARSVNLSNHQIKMYQEYCTQEKEFSATISVNQKSLSAFLQRIHWTEKRLREDHFTFSLYEIQLKHYVQLQKELQTLVFQKEEAILTRWFAENPIIQKDNCSTKVLSEENFSKDPLAKEENQKQKIAEKNEIGSPTDACTDAFEPLSDLEKYFLSDQQEEHSDSDSVVKGDNNNNQKLENEAKYQKEICADIRQHILLLRHLKSVKSIIESIKQSQESVRKQIREKEIHQIEFIRFFNEKVVELHLLLARCTYSIQIKFSKVFEEWGEKKNR